MTNPDLWSDTREPMVEIAPGRWIRAGITFQVVAGSDTSHCHCGSDQFRVRPDALAVCTSCDTTYRVE